MESADDFTRFADLLPEPMLLVTGVGEILAINRSGSTLSGYPAEKAVGQHLKDLVLDSPECLSALLLAWSRSKSFLPGSLTLIGPNGQATQCRAEGAALCPKSHETPSVIVIRLSHKLAAVTRFITLNQRIDELTLQVSRRRHAEQALEAQRELLRVTLESIGDAVIAADTDGRVTFMNQIACTLTGVEADNAVGKPLQEVFHIVNEQTKAKVEDPVTKVLQQGVIVGLANHTVLIRTDGAELPIDDSAAPIRGADGAMLGVILVFHDVTQRRALERELRERTEHLAQADRRKDEFLAMLAHELRNPLAPLLTGSHILRHMHSTDVTVQKIGDMMERQIQHLSRLIDDLLDVSRITRGKIELNRAPVSLRSVLEGALEMVEPVMRKHSHELSIFLPPDSICVDADATRLAQVFANLLGNAAKFTRPGGEISLRAEASGENAVVRVRDNGVGIEPELLPSIFELFSQGDKSLDRTEAGLGLGLSVVKGLTEMHEGTVEAKSSGRGQGAEFIVRLPTLSRYWKPVTPVGARSARYSNSASIARRVLIVDDNKDAAVTLAMLFRGWSHDVRCVHTGSEALALSTSFRPDMILLDIGLPEMDGYELARQFRNRPDTAKAKLIAVTGYGQDEERRRSQAAGFDEHLTKPVTLDVLMRLFEAEAP